MRCLYYSTGTNTDSCSRCEGKWKYYFDPAISLAITCIIFSSALPLGESRTRTCGRRLHANFKCATFSQERFIHLASGCAHFDLAGGRQSQHSRGRWCFVSSRGKHISLKPPNPPNVNCLGTPNKASHLATLRKDDRRVRPCPRCS